MIRNHVCSACVAGCPQNADVLAELYDVRDSVAALKADAKQARADGDVHKAVKLLDRGLCGDVSI